MKLNNPLKTTLITLFIIGTATLTTACNRHGIRIGHLPGIPVPIIIPNIPVPHVVVRTSKREHSARHNYHYYPNSSVYFDTGNNMYFFLSAGSWTSALKLPRSIRVSLGPSVSKVMDNARPYSKHHHHKKKYPRGWAKNKHKGRGKGKGNKHNHR